MKSKTIPGAMLPAGAFTWRNFFSWVTLVKFYNLLPFGVTTCKSVKDAKFYTAALLVVLSTVFLFLIPLAIYVLLSALRDGQGR